MVGELPTHFLAFLFGKGRSSFQAPRLKGSINSQVRLSIVGPLSHAEWSLRELEQLTFFFWAGVTGVLSLLRLPAGLRWIRRNAPQTWWVRFLFFMKLAKAELFNYTNLIFVSIIQEAESICMGHDNSAPLVEEIPVKREKVSESILETATCLNLIVLGPGWICHVQYNPKLSGFESFLSSLLNEMTWSKCLGWNKADSWPTFLRSVKDLDLTIPSLTSCLSPTWFFSVSGGRVEGG